MTDNLFSGPKRGCFSLKGGKTYTITIQNGKMGPGSYTVEYNRTATPSISPTSHDFLSHAAGDPATASFTFNAGAAFCDFAITISSVTLSDPSGHFNLTAVSSPSDTIAPGATRPVSVEYLPGSVAGTYSGKITINAVSVPPGRTVAPLTASVVGTTTTPIMAITSLTIDYHEVELGFSYHRAIQIRNIGDAPLTISLTQLCATDPTCSAEFASANFGPGALGGPYTIAPGGEHLVEQIFAPNTTGTHTIRIRVAGNDLTNPSRDVTLTGVGINPIPIDSVLALDRSGSMSGSADPRTKIEALRTAADLYVHLLRIGVDLASSDALGIVKYHDMNSVYLPFATMSAAQTAAAETALSPAAITDPTRLGPSGLTGIGGAMQTAAGVLPPPIAGRKHVMIVFTDGIENQTPYVGDVIGGIRTADPGLKIYSIGLGEDINATTLQNITNVTNGRFLATADLSGIHRYELETFYFKIFSNASGMSIVVDPTSPVAVTGSAPIVIGTAHLVSSDRYATFLVLDEPGLRNLYNLELIDPLGHIIDVGSSIAGVPVHIARRNNYSLYRIQFPNIASAPEYTGDWTLRLTPNGKWTPNLQDDRQIRTNDVINLSAGLVPIGFGVAVGSDYRMNTAATASATLPGADVLLTAWFTDRGAPSAGKTVIVNVTAPDRTEASGIQLFDDGTHGDAVAGDSTWTVHFTSTATPGVYQFLFRGVGRNERGELVPREESRWIALEAPNPPKCDCRDDNGCGDGSGGKPATVWYSFHLGHDLPLGNLERTYEPAASITIDTEVRLNNLFSAYAMLGDHYFHANKRASANLRLVNLSANLRRYFGGSTWPNFVQVGPGVYRDNGGSTHTGGNVGVGKLFTIHPKFGVEMGVDLHALQSSGTWWTFADAKLGVRFRF